MTRGSLSLLAGVVGLLLAAASIVVLFFLSGVFASARTKQLTGPGLDVFVLTPFPTADSEIVLDVASRGAFGSRAGIELVTVSAGGENLAIKHGKGDIKPPSGRGRGGSETVRVAFPVRLATRTDAMLPLAIEVDWVQRHGPRQSDTLHLTLEIHSSRSRLVAQLLRVLRALGTLLVWFAMLRGTLRRNMKTDDGTPWKLESAGIFVGFLGGASLGYWLFAWPIVSALELHEFGWSAFLFLVWAVAVPVLASPWSAKRPKNGRPRGRRRPRSRR